MIESLTNIIKYDDENTKSEFKRLLVHFAKKIKLGTDNIIGMI